MAGVLVTGKPRCGKSRWLKQVGIPDLRRRGVLVSVLDPIMGPLPPNVSKANWGADWVTDNVEHFMGAFDRSSHCAWVVDECGVWSKNYKDINAISRIAVAGGNFGHLGIFVAQRTMMIPPNIRNMCDTAVLFKQSPDDLYDLATLMDEPEILKAAELEQGCYMMVQSFKKPTIHRLF